MPTRIVTAKPPKRRPEPSTPKLALVARVVRYRKRGPRLPEPVEADPEETAKAREFVARMMRPPEL